MLIQILQALAMTLPMVKIFTVVIATIISLSHGLCFKNKTTNNNNK